jgi:low affinity Fe/Cu permease
MNRFLFMVGDFLSRPPGFYVLLIAMLLCTALVPFGLTNVVTYALSVAAIVITGVVLIQGYRDTAAIHAKLDEIIVSLEETRNDVGGIRACRARGDSGKASDVGRRSNEDGRPSQLAA